MVEYFVRLTYPEATAEEGDQEKKIVLFYRMKVMANIFCELKVKENNNMFSKN
jgi:hypothetical protein